MRTVLMLAAVLVVSLLIFRGYSFGPGADAAETTGSAQFDPVNRASDVDPLVEQAAEARRRALEQQQQ